ncbi:N-acetylmuramoyl-L-alanine amidase [bacterium]|nr:N-acetylmuramoyl-L-alanine amidase [bacterium]
MKRFILLMLLIPALVSAASLNTVLIDGEEFVAASHCLEPFGLRCFWSHFKQKGVFIFGSRPDTLIVTLGSEFVVFNGETYELKSHAVFYAGDIFLPKEGFFELLASKGYNLSEETEVKPRDTTPVQKKFDFKRVIIDPGHGGKDPGAIGPLGTYEKDITISIARKLKPILEKDGWEVYLTREDDRFLPLSERSEMANRLHGDIFISIHCNGSKRRSSEGFEVFFLSVAKTDEARAAEQLENSVLLLEDNPPTDNLDDLQFIITKMIQNEFLYESNELATCIDEAVGEELPHLRRRGVSQAGFYVLVGAFMPSVLVETAFISNPKEERLLRTSAFQSRIAESIAKGLRIFRERVK